MGVVDAKLQQLLHKAFKSRRIQAFAALLMDNVDLEYKYGKDQLTLLMMACIHPCCQEFVRLLLAAGADPNTRDPDGRTALHYAAFQSNAAALEILLAEKRTEVNAVDKEGSTALHYTASPSWTIKDMDQHLQCIALLMDHPHFEVNRPDIIGQTAITTAVLLHYNERIQVMLQHGKDKLNIDCSRVANGKSVREMIKRRFPELKRFLPPQRLESLISPDKHIRLLAALQHRDIDLFRDCLREDLDGNLSVDPNHWFDDPYYCTCLEFACRMKGSEEFVRSLLDAGADPNTTNKIYGIPVIHQATESGNYAVLEVLLKRGMAKLDVVDLSRHTALHVAAQKQCNSPEEIENIQRCISLLLDHEDIHVETMGLASWYDAVDALTHPEIDLNAQDEYGDTALHDAAHYGNKAVVLTLLRRGANIMKKNQEGDPPLAFIDMSTLDTFLDEQIRSNGLSPLSDDYQIVLKYTFLDPPTNDENDMSEMEALTYISRSKDLRPLLKHPVINSFLSLKWEMVNTIFYFNLVLYILFVALLTSYLLLLNAEEIESEPRKTEDSPEEYAASCLRYPIYGLIALLMFREAVQLATTPRRYIRDPENYLELLIIVVSSVALSQDWDGYKFKQHVPAVAILLSWFELIFMTGRLPILSVQLAMLSKVSYTFLRFMAWYSLLIIAFALSFYTLFRRGDKSQHENMDKFFLDPWLSILKTIMMMVGEFEASDIPFETVPVTSHLVFTVFIVLITVILLNLLNGLAVSDTQAIKEDAVVLSLTSMVKLVSYLETMLIRIVRATKFMYKGYYKKFMSPRIRLFDIDLPKKQIHAFPNTGQIKFLLDAETTQRFRRYRMDSDILKAATDIVTERRDLSEIREMRRRLEKYEKRFEDMDKVQKKTCDLMIETLNMVTSIQHNLKDNNI